MTTLEKNVFEPSIASSGVSRRWPTSVEFCVEPGERKSPVGSVTDGTRGG